MDVAEIQNRLDAIVVAMLAKGLREPVANAHIKSQATPGVYLQWKSKTEARHSSLGEAYEFISADNLPDALAKADVWVAARPSPEQAKLTEFMTAVGAAVDLGRELGIDAEFVNPLTVMMKTLSENALTHRAA